MNYYEEYKKLVEAEKSETDVDIRIETDKKIRDVLRSFFIDVFETYEKYKDIVSPFGFHGEWNDLYMQYKEAKEISKREGEFEFITKIRVVEREFDDSYNDFRDKILSKLSNTQTTDILSLFLPRGSKYLECDVYPGVTKWIQGKWINLIITKGELEEGGIASMIQRMVLLKQNVLKKNEISVRAQGTKDSIQARVESQDDFRDKCKRCADRLEDMRLKEKSKQWKSAGEKVSAIRRDSLLGEATTLLRMSAQGNKKSYDIAN